MIKTPPLARASKLKSLHFTKNQNTWFFSNHQKLTGANCEKPPPFGGGLGGF